MDSDVALPLPRGMWEKISESSTYWVPSAIFFIAFILFDEFGLWVAVTVATVPTLAADVLVRKIAQPRRRQRIEANLSRGVIEAVVRFPDEAGASPNSGWKAGCLSFTAGGFRFQQLRGRTHGPVGSPLVVPHPKLLGSRPLLPKEAPELEQGFQVLGFTVDRRDFEVAGDPEYLRGLELFGNQDSQDASA